jgi:thiol-disulfide isomerase/thioredoxin
MSVHDLTIHNFKVINNKVFINPQVMNGNPGIILIHAHWCGHCKRFMPTYQKIATQLNQAGESFACLAIENEELKKDNGAVSNALNIEGFPTMYWVDQNGKVLGQYKGDRDPNSILTQVCDVYHHCIQYHV